MQLRQFRADRILKKRNNDAFGDSHMELSDEGLRDRSSNHLSNVPNVM